MRTVGGRSVWLRRRFASGILAGVLSPLPVLPSSPAAQASDTSALPSITPGPRGDRGHILLIDESKELMELVSFGLGKAGYSVSTADGPGSAGAAIRDDRPDLVIIDMNVGRWNGLEVLSRVRYRSQVPVLMLIRPNGKDERAVALSMGADECLEKPLDLRTLKAAIERWLAHARLPASAAHPQVRVGPLTLDQAERVITRDGLALNLTRPEYSVLSYLMLHAGEPVSVTALARHVWGPGRLTGSALLKAALISLRHKLESDLARPALLRELADGIVLSGELNLTVGSG